MRNRNQVLGVKGLIGRGLFSGLICLGSSTVSAEAAKSEKNKTIAVFNSSYYKVNKIEGDAYFRRPFAIEWERVKVGLSLPFGSNVQLRKDAKIEFKYYYQNQGAWKALQTYVGFNNDVTLVLNEQLLRKVDMSSFVFSALRAKDTDGTDPNAESLDFQRAWNRVATYFRSEQAYSPELKETGEVEMQIGMRSKRISLVFPADGYSKYVTKFPASFTMIWDNPFDQPSAQFKIYLWRYQKAMTSPFAIARGDNFQIRINEPGSYYVRVTSLDDRYSSRPHLIHLVKDLPDMASSAPLDVGSTILDFPLNRYVALTPKRGVSLSFSGRILDPESKKDLRLVFSRKGERTKQDREGKDVIESVSLQQLEVFDLKKTLLPGRYEWWVDYEGRGDAGETAATRVNSEKRIFDLVADDGTRTAVERLLEERIEDFVHQGLPSRIFVGRAARAP